MSNNLAKAVEVGKGGSGGIAVLVLLGVIVGALAASVGAFVVLQTPGNASVTLGSETVSPLHPGQGSAADAAPLPRCYEPCLTEPMEGRLCLPGLRCLNDLCQSEFPCGETGQPPCACPTAAPPAEGSGHVASGRILASSKYRTETIPVVVGASSPMAITVTQALARDCVHPPIFGFVVAYGIDRFSSHSTPGAEPHRRCTHSILLQPEADLGEVAYVTVYSHAATDVVYDVWAKPVR